jgi:predicted NBD/HSP70 family sugar kinase
VRKIDLANFQVATSETARDINRRIVLNLIRKHQPVSRADLSRRSGLQRSTVSAITEQLIQERWITEGATGQLPRGRKPTFLHLNGRRAGIIGIDLRPLGTTIAVGGLDNQFLSQETFPTGKDPEKFVAELGIRLQDLMASQPDVQYEGIGIAVPGRVDSRTQRLVFAPNLGWKDVDMKTPLELVTGLPVEVENDANVCALGELWSAQYAEGMNDMLAVAVTEGVGVGMVINRQLVRGPNGIAGEFGHVVMEENGPQCNCGNKGCWEVFASNSAAVRYYTESLSRTRGRKSSVVSPSFDDILRLAEHGDSRAGQALDRMAMHLGAGIAMLVAGMAPEVVMVFGEITDAWERVGPIIERTVRERIPVQGRTRILPTNAAEHPRLHGTLCLVLQKHFGAPAIA